MSWWQASWVASASLAVAASVAGATTAPPCRQALLLGLDASLSVDPNEARLQRDGLAWALQDGQVVDALVGSRQSYVMLAIFEWSGRFDQHVIVDWTRVDHAEALTSIAATLSSAAQIQRTGRTALGEAMLFASEMLYAQSHCALLTLDISGDGPNNSGIPPEQAKHRMEGANITINGLVIEQPQPTDDAARFSLTAYYTNNVIRGAGAFTETIIGFDDYARAIKRKLLRELAPVIAGTTPSAKKARTAMLRQ